MSNIAKKRDNSAKPSRSREIQPKINYIEMAISDHEEDRNTDTLMREIIEANKPLEWKIQRCRILVNIYLAGVDHFEDELRYEKSNTT